MARGTQHLKKRPKQAPPPKQQRPRSEVRRTRRIEESGMFFPMLRRQAKWVFVLLAVVFAAGFVLFGVGSGSNGIGDILQNWLNIGRGSSGPSISSLQKTTQEHPTDAAAFRALATAYETKQNDDGAIAALERYTALRPKDANALQELAGLYQTKAGSISQNVQVTAAPIAQRSLFEPPPSTKLGQAYNNPGALSDPIDSAITSLAYQQQSQAQQQASTYQTRIFATYQKLARLQPNDPTTQLQLGGAAQAVNDRTTAIAAYRKFLKLSPDDPLVPQVKAQLKALQPTPAPASPTHR